MSDTSPSHWDVHSDGARADQLVIYDLMRRRCPVAHSDALGWSLFRHCDVMRALATPQVFSSVVSTRMSVPNGMDAPEHTEYRRVIEPYFASDRVAALEPKCRAIAAALVSQLPDGECVDVMANFAPRFALEAQCAFLNWPVELNRVLEQWTRDNHEATRKQDRAAMAEVARQFDTHIRAVLAERRRLSTHASDIAGELLRERVHGRVLSDEELVSILRNWTVGELATIAACVGILVHYLAAHSIVQQQLRENRALVPAAIDEILRIHPPLVASRRKTTEPVEVSGAHIGGGERVTLMWASANRDEAVFGDPDEFRLDRDPSTNLLYGAGIHVCPGAPLARLELRVLMEELLSATDWIERDMDTAPVKAVYPASGFARMPVIIRKT